MFAPEIQAPPDTRHSRSWRRVLAGVCTAVLAGAGLVLTPLAANADEASDAARAEATAASLIADELEATADADAANVVALQEALAAASALNDAAAAASLAAADDEALAAAAAQALLDFQNAEAEVAEAILVADASSAAAATARAHADELDAIASELEAALPPPASASSESADASLASRSNGCESHHPLTKEEGEKTGTDSYGDHGQGGYDHCDKKPEIDIYVKSLCPTVVKVKIDDVRESDHLEVWAGGQKVSASVEHGEIEFEVKDVPSGKFEVKVKYGHNKWVKDDVWIDKCPAISTKVKQECKTINGTGTVDVAIKDLQDWRDYEVTITSPNGYSKKFWIHDDGWWNTSLDLEPGTYTVSVESKNDPRHKPHVGPVKAEFTVAPCPGDVVITVNPTCATNGSGSLGAMLDGLVVGREYKVTVTGPAGTVTEVTFTATSSSWAVPPASLPPGTYTVTVVDTHGYASGEHSGHHGGHGGHHGDKGDRHGHGHGHGDKEHLTWTASGTIADCPPTTTTGGGGGGAALAATGVDPLLAGTVAFLLLPLGAAALVGSRRRREVKAV